MKLSEAIRLGSMLKPRGEGMTHNDGIHSCALVAALDAIGHPGSYSTATEHFPLCCMYAVHPVTKEPSWLVLSLARTLNDEYHWTREHIAEWVEGVEAAQEIGTPQTEDAVARVDHDQLVPTPRV